jgi:hypothetical protein
LICWALPNDGQNGIYISVINTKNPRGHQFVLLPKLINGSPSNFVGTFVLPGMDPKNVSEWLMWALERVSRSGLQLTYFTGRFNQSQLQRIEDANLTLGHHGLSEEVYAEARGVLDKLEEQTSVRAPYRLSEVLLRPWQVNRTYSGFGFGTRKPTRTGFPGGSTFMTLQTS